MSSTSAQLAPHYSMHIEWSQEDQAYVVILPEWADLYAMPVADGATIEEAVARGRNALENMVAFAHQDGTPLPEAHSFALAADRYG
jgi:predicted RNase H-like HicB family nuclease